MTSPFTKQRTKEAEHYFCCTLLDLVVTKEMNVSEVKAQWTSKNIKSRKNAPEHIIYRDFLSRSGSSFCWWPLSGDRSNSIQIQTAAKFYLTIPAAAPATILNLVSFPLTCSINLWHAAVFWHLDSGIWTITSLKLNIFILYYN